MARVATNKLRTLYIMDELSFMDEDERREAIEDAGLDPDDYDFD